MTREEERRKAASFSNMVSNDFIRGAEWADETMIEKAVNWFESVNLDYYQIREGVFSKELVTDFRRAMEE